MANFPYGFPACGQPVFPFLRASNPFKFKVSLCVCARQKVTQVLCLSADIRHAKKNP